MEKIEKFKMIILENNGRIKCCKHNIILLKNQIAFLREGNRDLRIQITNERKVIKK